MRLTDERLNALNQNVGNYRRFKWNHYEGKGITFTKDVVYGKEEIKVYNKYAELLSHSRNFLNSLSNRNEITNYFYGKTRFEVTLRSEKQIMERLGVGTGIIEFFDATEECDCRFVGMMYENGKRTYYTAEYYEYNDTCGFCSFDENGNHSSYSNTVESFEDFKNAILG